MKAPPEPPARPAAAGAAPSRPAASARWAGVVLALVRPLQVLAVVGLVAGAASIRVVAAGEAEIAASTDALRAGDAREAIVRARRAAGWYAPGAPHVRVAYERLVSIGIAAEGLGDRDTALLAWRGVRTASLETRWLVTPHAADLARANEAIARLSASAPRPPRRQDELPATVAREQLEALARDEAPRAGWVVVLVGSFLAWAGGAAWALRRAVSLTGHVSVRRAIPGLLLVAGGMALWILALWRA